MTSRTSRAVARHRNVVARGGFTMIENVVLFNAAVGPLAVRLYGALKHFAWKNAGDIPPQKELAESIGASERAIRDAFKALEAAGLVTVERQTGHPNVVWIEEPTPAKSAGGRRQDSPGPTPPSTRAREDLEDGSLSDDRERPPGVDNSGDDVEHRSRRGAVYDALIAELYPEGATLTAPEKRKVGMASVAIDKAGGGVEDVVERASRYRAHKTYGGVALTAMSLAAHWAELAPPLRARSSAPCVECEIGGGLHAAGCSRAAA